MRSSILWDVTQRILVVTDVSVPPNGQALKGPIGCPETLVINYQSSLRNIPEERRCYLWRAYRRNSSFFDSHNSQKSKLLLDCNTVYPAYSQ